MKVCLYALILLFIFQTSWASSKKEEKSPFFGMIEVFYGKGFDLFSYGTISTNISLGYAWNQKTKFKLYYAYKNDPIANVGRILYFHKKKKLSFAGDLSFQIPFTKTSRDNRLRTGVTGKLILSKKLGPLSTTFYQGFNYNLYSSEVDTLDKKLDLTHYSAKTFFEIAFNLMERLVAAGDMSLVYVWNFNGDKVLIQIYSAELKYKLHKKAFISAEIASSSKTLTFDTLFDDETSSYSLAFQFYF